MPLVIDLCAGLGGWTRGFLAEGYDAIGFDIERHVYGEKRYPAQLVLQDIATLDGSQFRDAAVIVASPPCQAYSYRAMPWKRAKALPPPDNSLFDHCFRIAREAGVPIVVENVKGAQPWVGRAAWHYGSYYLWGDVPALMIPAINGLKGPGGGWLEGQRNDPRDVRGGVRQSGMPGREWFAGERSMGRFSSRSAARKAASAMIAEIPFDLAQWIARCFKDSDYRRECNSQGDPSAGDGQSVPKN